MNIHRHLPFLWIEVIYIHTNPPSVCLATILYVKGDLIVKFSVRKVFCVLQYSLGPFKVQKTYNREWYNNVSYSLVLYTCNVNKVKELRYYYGDGFIAVIEFHFVQFANWRIFQELNQVKGLYLFEIRKLLVVVAARLRRCANSRTESYCFCHSRGRRRHSCLIFLRTSSS